MAQQTAVQKLIQDIRNNNDVCFLNNLHIDYYLAMEKEQIEKAFDIGFNRGHESGENHDWHEGENRGSEFYEQEYLGKKRIYPDDYPEWAKQETYESNNGI